MRTIHKYRLDGDNPVTVMAPARATPIFIDVQRGDLCVWMEIDTDFTIPVPHRFWVIGTGHPLPHNNVTHVSSVQDGMYVWHVYKEN